MSAATAGAQRTVLYSVVAVGALTTIRDLGNDQPPQVRVALGCAVLGLGLTALAGPAPKVASGLALLLFVSALSLMGAEVAGRVQAGIDPAPNRK